MARGTEAKNLVIKKIAETFGDNYLGFEGSKVYVEEDEGGEKVQICLTLTAPKTLFSGNKKAIPDAPAKKSGGISFDEGWDFDDAPRTPDPVEKIEITKEEEDNIKALMEKLGL